MGHRCGHVIARLFSIAISGVSESSIGKATNGALVNEDIFIFTQTLGFLTEFTRSEFLRSLV